MGCDQHNNGLQFYINTVAASASTCQGDEMEMKRCRFVLADDAVCQFECQCLAEPGVCQVGVLWKTHDMTQTPVGEVCEVLMA